MADEGGSGDNPLFWVVILLMVFVTFGGSRLTGGEGSGGPFNFSLFGPISQPISVDTPLGTRVVHNSDTPIYTEPGSEEQVAVAPAGSDGSIIGGPVQINGQEWWRVRYSNGVEGWVPGSSITPDEASNMVAVTETTPIGTRIINTREVEVFASPGAGQLLGVRPKGAQGTFLQQSLSPEGTPVSKIDYDFGPDGWVDQDAVQIDLVLNQYAITGGTPVGSKVLSNEKLTVRQQPRRSASRVSEVSKGVAGTVTDGPVNVDNELWFEISFENGVSGWVLRDDLALDTTNDPFALKENTPLGIVIEHTKNKQLWSEPGGGRELGQGQDGVQGTLTDGPVFFDGEMWWNVDYGDGTFAWVTSDGVEIVTGKSRKRVKAPKDTSSDTEPQKAGGGFLRFLKSVGLFLAFFFIIGILYVTFKLNTIRAKEQKEIKINADSFKVTTKQENTKWAHIEELIESNNENDWRAAIIEADIMLDELMTAMGYLQDTLGDKLKAVEKSDFNTISEAWEAHLFRNKLAHEGSNVSLSHREARRIISLFEKVFKEFEQI